MGNLMTSGDPNPHNIIIDIHDLSRRQIFVLKFQVHLGFFKLLWRVLPAQQTEVQDEKGNSQSDKVTPHNRNLTM